jgi:hypothetical protein
MRLCRPLGDSAVKRLIFGRSCKKVWGEPGVCMFRGGRSPLGDSRADSRGFSRGLRARFLLWGEPGARYARGDSPFDPL